MTILLACLAYIRWHSMWHILSGILLTSVYILAFVWHSSWYILWHPMWQSAWHNLTFYPVCHYFWHSIRHAAILHQFWHSIRILSGSCLASNLTFSLASCSVSILTFSPASCLASTIYSVWCVFLHSGMFGSVCVLPDLELAIGARDRACVDSPQLQVLAAHKTTRPHSDPEGILRWGSGPCIPRLLWSSPSPLLQRHYSTWAGACWERSVCWRPQWPRASKKNREGEEEEESRRWWWWRWWWWWWSWSWWCLWCQSRRRKKKSHFW